MTFINRVIDKKRSEDNSVHSNHQRDRLDVILLFERVQSFNHLFEGRSSWRLQVCTAANNGDEFNKEKIVLNVRHRNNIYLLHPGPDGQPFPPTLHPRPWALVSEQRSAFHLARQNSRRFNKHTQERPVHIAKSRAEVIVAAALVSIVSL